MYRCLALQPCVFRQCFGADQTVEQLLPLRLSSVYSLLANLLNAQALDEVVSALQVVRVFAVVLEKEIARFKSLFRGFHRDQQVGLADRFAGSPSHHHLPTALLPHHSDVLHGGLGTVPWASHHAHFDLVRRKQILQTPLQFDTGARGILHAEAAEFRAHASLYHANALGVGLTRRHAEIGPYFRQVGLLDSQKIDALASRDFHHPHFVLIGDVGDAAELVGCGHAPAHARDNREGAVLLNIGVHAVVDEASRPVFLVIAAPNHVEHVAQRRFADFAALAITVDVQYFLHRLELLAANNVAELFVGERYAGA